MFARKRLLASLARIATSVAWVSARSRPDRYSGMATSPISSPTPRLRLACQYGVSSSTPPKLSAAMLIAAYRYRVPKRRPLPTVTHRIST